MFRAAIFSLAALLAAPAQADIVDARFDRPTTRYDHGILGDAIEWGMLRIITRDLRQIRIILPESRVFEDIKPRLADVDGDGNNEVLVVETSLELGAQLAIYDESGKIAATPFLGRPHRWLAPVGVADLDGDGRPEIAYVEKPHLRKILKVWRFTNGKLTQLASQSGLTNHQIGWDFIVGGIRDCGDGPEIITADANWKSVMATRLKRRQLTARRLGPVKSTASFRRALACEF
ncbi:MAG: VCBS repeat-containing protein [Paracoccaceae bacterium]|nr:VCBS repeat-containing protein [Paracoccaceae bacterium]